MRVFLVIFFYLDTDLFSSTCSSASSRLLCHTTNPIIATNKIEMMPDIKSSSLNFMIAGAKSRLTRFITLIIGLRAGPAVSL